MQGQANAWGQDPSADAFLILCLAVDAVVTGALVGTHGEDVHLILFLPPRLPDGMDAQIENPSLQNRAALPFDLASFCS
jgi:hypothetical protein